MKSNSWVITRKSDKEVIGEFFDYQNVLKFNPEMVTIETSHDYLCRINQEIKNS